MTGNGATWSFTYDADGMRTRRTGAGKDYSYTYNGGSLVHLDANGDILSFTYDASGSPQTVTYNGTQYYYVTNLQGDIIGIVNGSGTSVVTYAYDAWGNHLSTSGTMASTLGTLNPLRYRGYVYDTETGLYYLQSRYYNPTTGRFLNADALASTGQGLLGNNMFAYCLNNPVNFVDVAGLLPELFRSINDWLDRNVFGPIADFAEKFNEDIKAFNIHNEDELYALDSNYFSCYKGVIVIRTNGSRSGSFVMIFLTHSTNDRENPEDVVRHEYGHYLTLKEVGLINYALCFGIPSWQMWGSDPYYDKPWELIADIFGQVQSRTHSKEDIIRAFIYLIRSEKEGFFVWRTIE